MKEASSQMPSDVRPSDRAGASEERGRGRGAEAPGWVVVVVICYYLCMDVIAMIRGQCAMTAACLGC